MKLTKIPYSATNAFSTLALDFLAQKDNLKPFLNRFPTVENFKLQLEEKKNFSPEQRQILVETLEKQYHNIEKTAFVQRNITALKGANSFTVTTGHQLNIFTGPLYFIYKIVTAIKTCAQLQKEYPDYNFVPVYWMASEDHDFAEINHFSLFGKKYEWQSNQAGAVGRFNPKELQTVLKELPQQYPFFEQAYLESETLSEATRKIINALFGEFGLVCLDADEPELKKVLTPVIKNELLENTSYRRVNTTNETLAAYYKPQVLAREINLFYLEDGLRERIIKEEETFKVLNTDLSFSQETILKLAETEPSTFSPNVILRPLYQELILPNLAYIGGGAEVAYWLQLKGIFDAYQVAFPIIMLRNSAMYMTKNSSQKLKKLSLKPEEIFAPLADLKKRITENLNLPDINAEVARTKIQEAYSDIEKFAISIDPTLEKAVLAEAKRTLNSLHALEKRIIKAMEAKYDTVFNHLTTVKERLFPGSILQERVENMLTFQNQDFIVELILAFEPFEPDFTILEEE